MRTPPYWLSWPRTLQGRITQLWTGRAHLQSFLHLLNSEEYRPFCPLGDGPGTLEHYIHSCRATLTWREQVARNFDNAHIPDWTTLLYYQPHFIFALIDHSALGAVYFTKKIRCPW